MKRFFISAIVSMGCFMAHAQSVTIPEVSIVPGGEKSVDVTIAEGTQYTAFQFDVALPTGVSLKSASFKSKGATREITSGKVDGKYRVLSYATDNKKLAETEVLSLTFAATNEFTADAETAVDGIVIVDPEGNSATTTNGTVAFKVGEAETITIGSSEMTTYVCNSGLDFTDREEKAYVVSGIVGDKVLISRIYIVPAGTPIVVKGSQGNHSLPKTNVTGLYYKSLLIGNNTDAAINVTPEGTDQFLRLTTDGFQRFSETKSVGAHKAYIRAKALPAANAGSALPLSIGSGQKTSLCTNVDLDFSNEENLKVYIASGYNGSVLISRVKKASAGTPLYIKGPQGEYTIPSAAAQTVYANMMVGNNSDESITINQTDGDYTNLYVSTSGFTTFTGSRSVGAHKSYLQILTSYMPATSRGIPDGNILIGESEVEMMSIPIMKSIGFDDDETTGISRVASEVDNDVWYNLKGQRIDAPTRKGLYIKNGQKVVVK